MTKRKISWVKDEINQLTENETCQVRPIRGSMRRRIESGQLVTIEKYKGGLKIDDVIFIKWKKNYLLHIASNIEEDQIEISNNLGKINGWITENDIIGKVIKVEN